MNFLIQLLSISLMISLYNCYPSGAPLSACDGMFPNHAEAIMMRGTAPFFIEAIKTRGVYRVTLQSRGNSEFKGFLMQARTHINVASTTFGSWKKLDAHTRTLDCFGMQQSAVTHAWTNSNVGSLKSASFEWTPSESVSHFYFFATVVENFGTLWMNITLRV